MGGAGIWRKQQARRGRQRTSSFSDGTGNSSTKLQKTNVWRLYEALDLGTIDAQGQPANPIQIAYYDNGVGTSSVPLLAAIGGAFVSASPATSARSTNSYAGIMKTATGFSRSDFHEARSPSGCSSHWLHARASSVAAPKPNWT